MSIYSFAKCTGWLFCFVILLACRAEPPTPAGKSGTIAGTVSYQADPKRPWRQARYYIKDPAKGQLAEALIALIGKDLGKNSTKPKPAMTVVDQKNFMFTPEIVAIRAGDSVKFLNSDKELHNVNVFHKLHSFNVTMPSGGSHIEPFEHATEITRPYQLGCVYHGGMRGWVYVFDHPFFKITGTDGAFKLDQVPPGKYQLEMVHPAGQLRWSEEIEVKPGQEIRKDIRVSPDNPLRK
jgi:plastocyanin